MKVITENNFLKNNIGSKARNLFLLKKNNINVPKLFCISSQERLNEDDIYKYIDNNFSDDQKFAVRSSSSVEDGSSLSFAGQFDTFLNVDKKDLIDKIEKCRTSIYNKNLDRYANKKDINMNVIVQEMLNPEKSGIIFTSNPQGILNESVIVVGDGIGENVVSDRISTTTYYYNKTDDIYYYERQNNSALLEKNQINELINISKEIQKILGEKLDIEFAIENNEIYILQARDITTLDMKAKIILDNSNIVESYSGITLPLTQSFIKEAYYGVFNGVLYRITRSNEILEKYKDVVSNIIAVANGRVYYQINNLYNILKLLPFEKKLIPIWQEMLGVENKDIEWDKKLKVNLNVKIKIVNSFFNLLKTNISEMKNLEIYFKDIEEYYNNNFQKNMDNDSLIKLYENIKNKVFAKWDITLVNDMYAFIYTALVKRQLKKEKVSEYENVSNMLISNLSNLESMKPIEKLIELSIFVKENNIDKVLEKIETNEDYYNLINSSVVDKEFKIKIQSYIQEYGDRNVEELKLESKTFRTSPVLLIRKIIEYVNDDNLINYLKEENKKDSVTLNLSNKTKEYLNKAGEGIRSREKSRLARSKLYGFMRNIVLNIGNNFKLENIIEDVDDIFYLYYNEIIDIINGKNINVKKIINSRKQEYKMYGALPAYTRLVFCNNIVNKSHQNINNDKIIVSEEKLKGIPCSSGIITGEVVFVDKSNFNNVDVKGKIIVTKMTDPGWVFLITQSIGIVSEKGSLLSHSAIISRELKKPSVFGVRGITQAVKNGDIIRLDANNGIIEIVEK